MWDGKDLTTIQKIVNRTTRIISGCHGLENADKAECQIRSCCHRISEARKTALWSWSTQEVLLKSFKCTYLQRQYGFQQYPQNCLTRNLLFKNGNKMSWIAFRSLWVTVWSYACSTSSPWAHQIYMIFSRAMFHETVFRYSSKCIQ